MTPLRDHQQQLHEIRSSFRDSGVISVIPKPIENAELDLCEGERTNLRPILSKISILAGKNKRFVEEACRYDRRCENPRAFLFCENN